MEMFYGAQSQEHGSPYWQNWARTEPQTLINQQRPAPVSNEQGCRGCRLQDHTPNPAAKRLTAIFWWHVNSDILTIAVKALWRQQRKDRGISWDGSWGHLLRVALESLPSRLQTGGRGMRGTRLAERKPGSSINIWSRKSKEKTVSILSES